MKNIEHYYEMVENIIKKLGVDPLNCRGEQPGQWNLTKGSSNVWVDVWKLKEEDYGYIQIMAPICEFPAENQTEFMREALEINHTLYGVGFTKHKNWLYIKGIRELDGLDENEAYAMFNRVGNYADEYDDYFKDSYFGESC